MKFGKKYGLATLAIAMTIAPVGLYANAQTAGGGGAQASSASSGQDADDARIAAIPIDKLITATCRQAWQMGGRDKEGFFEIVKRLAAVSAENRDVTLPDNKSAGQRAGQWIRTQALKDPDQLLFAVVDHAVRYSNEKEHTPAAGGSASGGAGAAKQ